MPLLFAAPLARPLGCAAAPALALRARRRSHAVAVAQRPTSPPPSPSPSPSPPAPAVASLPVPDHPNWRYAGPALTSPPTPLPAILYFALTATQSLELHPFNQLPAFALGTTAPSPSPAPPLRVFSVTLPFHGTMAENERALSAWADTYAAGGDVVAFFARRVSATLDALILAGHIDGANVHAAGLSRGGLLAAHVALTNPSIRSLLGFSPVTTLAGLAEFRGLAAAAAAAPGGSLARRLHRASLLSDHAVDRLSYKNVRFYSGNSDRRVGTRHVFDVMEALTLRAEQRNERALPFEVVFYCSIGREGHGTSTDVFGVGARWILRRAGLLHK